MTGRELRETAALMRERAEACRREGIPEWYSETAVGLGGINRDDRPHIAAWSPAVALEVAAFLDFAGAYGDQPEPQSPTVQFAVAIARAYREGGAA